MWSEAIWDAKSKHGTEECETMLHPNSFKYQTRALCRLERWLLNLNSWQLMDALASLDSWQEVESGQKGSSQSAPAT